MDEVREAISLVYLFYPWLASKLAEEPSPFSIRSSMRKPRTCSTPILVTGSNPAIR
jgi:hypothetical protein